MYAKFLERIRNRFDIFGALPDVIDDDWVEDEEELEARPSENMERTRSISDAPAT